MITSKTSATHAAIYMALHERPLIGWYYATEAAALEYGVSLPELQRTIHLATHIAQEQGGTESDLWDWVDNRTYPLGTLFAAANGDAAALAMVRREAGLSTI